MPSDFSLRCFQAGGRDVLLHLRPLVPISLYLPAFFYCLWTAATARSGDSQIYRASRIGEAAPDVWRWHYGARLHVCRGHRERSLERAEVGRTFELSSSG